MLWPDEPCRKLVNLVRRTRCKLRCNSASDQAQKSRAVTKLNGLKTNMLGNINQIPKPLGREFELPQPHDCSIPCARTSALV
jgi:hypothetical protein